MTDVLVRQTEDGGDIEYVNGRVTMHDGLYGAAYFSLFGGNEDDSTLEGDNRKQFWGNLLETDPARMYRSRTQYLLKSLPCTPHNLRRVEDAGKQDLAWMTDSGIADEVVVTARIPGVHKIALRIEITVDGRAFAFDFTREWIGSRQ